jgi:hypothetical protein
MRELKGLVREGVNIVPNVYNGFFSHAQLSDKRKEEISLRRDQLKVMDNDPVILRIVIHEILSYKPRFLTLDDRYLQLEKILDAIDKARENKNTDHLVSTCSSLFNELSESSNNLNTLLKCLTRINSKISETQSTRPKAKL